MGHSIKPKGLEQIKNHNKKVKKASDKNIALVLSSGSARGLAHIGAIEELETQGYHITSIAGCSMGALIGGIYAAGKLQEYREWMRTIDRKKMLDLMDLSLSINHIIKGERIINALMEIVPDVAIEDLPIPYCAIATDWKSGKEIIFRKGSLFDAIRASISLPSFFSPVKKGEMILLDGGIMNPLPLNRVIRQNGDLLVGVDVSCNDYTLKNDLEKEAETRIKRNHSISQMILDKLRPKNLDFNYFTLLSRTSSLMIRQNSMLMTQLMEPDILIDIKLPSIDSFDYNKSEQIINLGRQQTQKKLALSTQNK